MSIFYRGHTYIVVMGATETQVNHLACSRPWVPHKLGESVYFLSCRGKVEAAARELTAMGFTDGSIPAALQSMPPAL